MEHRLQHVRNQRLQFDAETHTYTLDGRQKLTSVTTVIETYFPKFDPDVAIQKMKRKGTHPLARKTPEEIKRVWQEKKEKSQAAGTRMHEAIEAHLKGETVADHQDVLRFVDAIRPTTLGELVTTEWAIFDEEWGIAGTLDALFQTGEHFMLADWKRSKIKNANRWETALRPIAHLQACNFEKYSLQLSLYRLILERRYDIAFGPNTPTLVQLHPESVFKAIPTLDRRQEVLNLVADFCQRQGS